MSAEEPRHSSNPPTRHVRLERTAERAMSDPTSNSARQVPPASATRSSASRPESPEPDVDLICLGCGKTPTKVAFSTSEKVLIHDANAAHARHDGIRAMCGGQVVPADAQWYAALAPGAIAQCTLRAPNRTLHRVRLGRPVTPETGSWTGTALCTLRPKGLWFPAAPESLQEGRACRDCEREYGLLGARA